MFTKFFASAVALMSLTNVAFAQESTKTPVVAKTAPVTATKKAAAKKPAKTEKATKAEVGIVALNKATAKELETLPGIGPAIAERIVAYRTEQGKFSELSELMEVKGIGEKKLAQLRPHLTLD